MARKWRIEQSLAAETPALAAEAVYPDSDGRKMADDQLAAACDLLRDRGPASAVPQPLPTCMCECPVRIEVLRILAIAVRGVQWTAQRGLDLA